MRFIAGSPTWLQQAKDRLTHDAHPKLASAYTEVVERSPVFKLQETIRILDKWGLSVELGPEPPPAKQSLPRFICDTLFNPRSPSPPTFTLNHNGQSTVLPLRTHLVLLYIAFFFHITIYLFSGRAKPLVFASPDSIASIGIFHWIDTTGTTSSYHALVPSHEPRATRLKPEPAKPVELTVPPATWREGERPRQRNLKVYPDLTRDDCVETMKRVL